MPKLIKTFTFVAMMGTAFCLSACSSALTTVPAANSPEQSAAPLTQTDAVNVVESASPAPIGEGELGVGTITGNPGGKPIRQLILRTITDDSEKNAADDESVAAQSAESGSPPETTTGTEAWNGCGSGDVIGLEFIGTRGCTVTPVEFNMGVRQISLISCVSPNGNAVTCDAFVTHESETVLPLVTAGDDAILRLEIDDAGINLAFDDGADTDALDVGGIAFTVSYIEQRLPAPETDPAEAEKIAPELQNKLYRICTTGEAAPEADMEFHCGVATARFGDVLWDLDGDGGFGFLLSDAAGFYESDERPASRRKGLMNVRNILERTTRPGLGTNERGTFFDFIASFDDVTDVASASGFDIEIAFDITGTFRFIDGQAHRARACRESATRAQCASKSREDPKSPGWYDPHDDALVPEPPGILILDRL